MDKKWEAFCENWLADYPDILTVLEVKAITGYCKTSVQGWIDRGLIEAFLTRRSNKIPKESLLRFMSSSKFRNMHVKSKMTAEKRKRSDYAKMLKKYPDVLKIEQMCEALGGMSTKTGYKMLREGRIGSVKVGREYRITKVDIIDYLMKAN